MRIHWTLMAPFLYTPLNPYNLFFVSDITVEDNCCYINLITGSIVKSDPSGILTDIIPLCL